jgi:FKBP-type peptidyl-prolyl cis-trans isomerase
MENAKKKGVKTTSSGLQYEVIAQGSGEKPVFDSYVVVNYTGSLIDGSVFDSNRETGGDPATIPLEGVIEGWAEGVRLMNVGGHYKLYIPPDLAYGADGAGDTIPPNSVLVFDVELLDIEK